MIKIYKVNYHIFYFNLNKLFIYGDWISVSLFIGVRTVDHFFFCLSWKAYKKIEEFFSLIYSFIDFVSH